MLTSALAQNLPGTVYKVLERYPAVGASMARVESAQADIQRARGAHWPQLSWSGTYSQYHESNLVNHWIQSPTVNLNLLSGRKIQSDVCPLYTSDAADDPTRVCHCARRIFNHRHRYTTQEYAHHILGYLHEQSCRYSNFSHMSSLPRRILSPWCVICFSSSRLHFFSCSHLLFFPSPLLLCFSSSLLLFFAASLLLFFSSSLLLFFSPSLFLFFSSSRLPVFSSSLLCFSSSLFSFFSLVSNI